VPVLTEPDGKKLAKSARSVRLEVDSAIAAALVGVFELLNLAPPPTLSLATIPAWRWAAMGMHRSRHLSLQTSENA
jgi:hypothetical protein